MMKTHNSMKFTTLFHYCCAAILLITGAFKLVSAFGDLAILLEAHPMFGVSNRVVFLGAGLLELAGAACLFFGKNVNMKHAVVVWFASVFTVYRTLAYWLPGPHMCPCMGRLGDWFPLLLPYMSLILWSIIAFFYFGTAAVIWYPATRLKLGYTKPFAVMLLFSTLVGNADAQITNITDQFKAFFENPPTIEKCLVEVCVVQPNLTGAALNGDPATDCYFAFLRYQTNGFFLP